MGKKSNYKICHNIMVSVICLLPFSVFSQYTGGTDDGFTTVALARTNITDFIAFSGGAGNGFAAVTVYKIDFADAIVFRGGYSDGFNSIFLPAINITDAIAFNGGIGRGEAQGALISCTDGTVIWNGMQSTDWLNPANWNCAALPSINSNVIIPFDVPNYPIVSTNVEIRSLQVSTNATVTVNTGVHIILNGQ